MSNLSFVKHVGDGVTTTFLLAVGGDNIGYLDTRDIYVYVDGVEVTFSIQPASPHLAILDEAPADGSDVLIRRQVSKTDTYSDFSRGNVFSQKNMNNSFLQTLYLSQEWLDGFLPEGSYQKQDMDFGSKFAPTNLRAPVVPSDAVTKEYADVISDRVTEIENTVISGDTRFLSYTYKNGSADGGEIFLSVPYVFQSINRVYINGSNQTYGLAWDFEVNTQLIELAEELEAGDEVVIEIGFEPEKVLDNEIVSGASEIVATGTTTPRSLADRWADMVNARDFSSLVSSGDWTIAIQTAIDHATTLNKSLYIPSGIYTISQSGVFNGRGYGLLLRSNLHIIGAGKDTTIFRASQDADIDLFNTDRTTSHSNVSLSNLTLDGNEQNRTGTTLAGFNLWAFGITDLSLSNVKSINTGSWGLRIQSCEHVELLNIRCDHSAESNSDGIHFVDTSHVVGSNISIYTEGDDAFIIEANTKNVVDYNISSLSVSAPNGLALPARGILLLVDHDVATAAWNINDIVIDATVKDCTGHGVILVGGKYEGVNIKAVVSGGCSFASLYLQPGFAGNTGHILNSSFDITSRDLTGSGVICTDDFGIIEDNSIHVSAYNPAEGKVSVNLKGDRWSGDIKSNYNPNSDKTAFAQGVVLHGVNNTLTINSIGSQVNLLLQATSQDNNITLGELGDSTVYDLQIVSGSEGHCFSGGRVRGNVSIPFNNTSKFSAVGRLTNRFKTTIDMSVNADGTASIPHELAATPVTSLVTLNVGSMLTHVVTSQDSTDIGVLIHNNSGSPVTTGIFNIFVDTSL